MMKTERKSGGVLVAHSMGLEKVNAPWRILLEES